MSSSSETSDSEDEYSCSESDCELIQFAWPGLRIPDTRFKLFGNYAEFHVHSAILKMHSAFFRKFLDSPDKKCPAPSAPFRYEWISKYEGNGKWCLVSVGSDLSNNKPISERRATEYTRDLKSLLSAFYQREYGLASFKDFERLVELADYYCALPTLSYSLTNALARRPVFVRFWAMHNCARSLELAVQLRNPTIFKEVMILAMNPWDNPRYANPAYGGKPLGQYDSKIQLAIMKAFKSWTNRITMVEQELLRMGARATWYPEVVKKILDDFWKDNDKRKDIPLPTYFRAISKALVERGDKSLAKPYIDVLFTNDLKFSSSFFRDPDFDTSFQDLCIDDKEDYPWDSEQIDW
ncbi:hypothetical protein PVAG01_02077 [Phlyctema vagabunda]|uniref:BTB domain-containing protein n=1 Tax=Phlyctema vagabunda TaxID=108571 RepID=A0ABR4PQV4_9HELO